MDQLKEKKNSTIQLHQRVLAGCREGTELANSAALQMANKELFGSPFCSSICAARAVLNLRPLEKIC
jgi:hypothetical protein